jgi:hypothetical protein
LSRAAASVGAVPGARRTPVRASAAWAVTTTAARRGRGRALGAELSAPTAQAAGDGHRPEFRGLSDLPPGVDWRIRTVVWASAISLPLAGLALPLGYPSLDVRWEQHPSTSGSC